MKEELDLDAGHYREHSQQQYDRASLLFKSKDFSRGAHVLDVGCGDGKITAEIAALVPEGKIIGIDSSQNMISFAKKSFQLPNLSFQCMKAEEAMLSDSFDNIFCFNCLLWIRKPRQALDCLSKLLRPDGELVILTYLRESAYVDILEETLEQFPLYKELSAARTMLTLESHRTILEANGLCIESFEVQNLISCYSTSEDLMNYLQGWIRSYVPLPDDQQNAFLRRAVYDCCNSEKFQVESSICLPYKGLVIRGRKKNNDK